MAICSAYGCSNRTDRKRKPGVSFHKFPKEKALREQWVKAVRRLNWEPGVNSFLCSEHFSVEFLNHTFASGRTELRENAVPTIFSNYPSYLQPPIKKKIRKPPRSRAAEPTPTTSAEPIPPSIPENIEFSSEEPMEISEPFSKEVAVQVSGDSTIKELVNLNKYLEWKVNTLKSRLHQKSIAIKKVKKQNLRLNVRISSLKSLIKEGIGKRFADCIYMKEKKAENMKVSDAEGLDSQEYLICLVEAHPILYDALNPDHGNEIKIAETWQIISDVIDLPVEDCQKEWHTLLSKYKKQRKTILEYEAKGSKAKSSWALYDTFNFIDKLLSLQEIPVTPSDTYKSLMQDLIQNIKSQDTQSLKDHDSNNTKDFDSNEFEMNYSEPQPKKFKVGQMSNTSPWGRRRESPSSIRQSEDISETTINRRGETIPVITDINEDVQFVNSILPVLVRMKRKKKAQCKAQLMAALANYVSDDET